MPHVRCSKCAARATLPRRPEEYIRLPKCRGCQRKMTLDGKPPPGSRESPRRYARYRIDKYRQRHERGAGSRRKLCHPGRGGCGGYSFPHRRGSGYCWHNPNLTENDMRERHESGQWA